MFCGGKAAAVWNSVERLSTEQRVENSMRRGAVDGRRERRVEVEVEVEVAVGVLGME